ncbi:hypothetical protein Agub_g6742 [Astrephomene gubernaculifera]|uniref:Cytochrome P450 n=1 Tax=Astrephomene gubernaculifera TaxID=47775 RepID=A0AAD3HLQ9_9CHLO|nr:hypothetical protein Agub_g6742 [Astrephomene gubernaculifera]
MPDIPIVGSYFSTSGPLGIWTPAVAISLNIIAAWIIVALIRAIAYLRAPKYDLFKLPSPANSGLILGHAKALLTRPDYHRLLLECARECGSIFRLRLLHRHVAVIMDPAAAAHVLSVVPGRPHSYGHVDEVLGGRGVHSMFGTSDEVHWRAVRKATAPAFAMANVRRYFRGVLTAAGELLSRLEADMKGQEGGEGEAEAGSDPRVGGAVKVEMEPLLQRMMLRATLEGLLEVPDATRVPGFDTLAPSIVLLMAEANAQITDPLRALWYRTPLAPLCSKHVASCRRALREVTDFHTRTAAAILARPDPAPTNTLLWACLHRLRDWRGGSSAGASGGEGGRLSPQQLHPEVGMYTTAGFDTTASTLGWCLYAVALHPGHQRALLQELRQYGIFPPECVVTAVRKKNKNKNKENNEKKKNNSESCSHGGKAEDPETKRDTEAEAVEEEETEEAAGRAVELELDAGRCPGPEELARLPLLNAFVWEVMRLFPTAGVSAERLSPTQPVRLPSGLTLPPGVSLWTPMYGLHASDLNWQHAEEFRPERWLEDPHCAFARTLPDNNNNTSTSSSTAAAAAAAAPDVSGCAAAAAAAAAGGGGGGAAGGFENTQRGGGAAHAEEGGAARRFMPFGEGPKNCVGQNFGIAVVRAVFALLLRRYYIALHPNMMGELLQGAEGAAEGAAGEGGEEGGCLVSCLATRTAALTQVAVATKLRRLRLVLSRRQE